MTYGDTEYKVFIDGWTVFEGEKLTKEAVLEAVGAVFDGKKVSVYFGMQMSDYWADGTHDGKDAVEGFGHSGGCSPFWVLGWQLKPSLQSPAPAQYCAA